MKQLLLSASLLIGAFASAESIQHKVCGQFMECGTYVHNFTEDGVAGSTTITVSAKEYDSVSFDYVIRYREESNAWNLVGTFADDGSFVMKRADGSLYATGICKTIVDTDEMLCGYTQSPWLPQGHTVARVNVGMIRFANGEMEFLMNWGAPKSTESEVRIFKRQ